MSGLKRYVNNLYTTAGLIAAGGFVGTGVGLTVGLFRYLLDKIELRTQYLYHTFVKDPLVILLWLLCLSLLGLLLGRLCTDIPAVRGSGIPQVKALIAGQAAAGKPTVIPIRFAGSLIAAGGGLPLGRAGPSIHLGAAIGQSLFRLLHRQPTEETALLLGGAGAGLAAVFGAPCAGIAYSWEEFRPKQFRNIIPAISAALTANASMHIVFHYGALLSFVPMPVLPKFFYVDLVGLGIVTGLSGIVFTVVLRYTVRAYASQAWLPIQFRPVIPLTAAGLLAFCLPEALGSGCHLLTEVTHVVYPLSFLLLLLSAKLGLTLLSFGSGVPGGLFMPVLIIGAILGNIGGSTLTHFTGLTPALLPIFTILAMAGFLSAVLRAPLTGFFLSAELCGTYGLLPAALLVSLSAYLIAVIFPASPLNALLTDEADRATKTGPAAPD